MIICQLNMHCKQHKLKKFPLTRPYNKIVVKDKSFVISKFPYKLLKYSKTARTRLIQNF
jgi:hypothetical protein